MRLAAWLSLAALCAQQVPYKDGRTQPSTFEAPDRDAPEPANLANVAIGYFGPADPSHPGGGSVWQGASLALEEANREGGYRAKPFRLVTRWSEDPWRAGASHITRMVFQDRVWAVIGGIEGAGTHLAAQVAAKALVPLVNPVATDRSIHGAAVPWIFSIVQGDDRHAAVLTRALRGRSVTLFAATDHDSRVFGERLSRNVPVRLQVVFDPRRPDLAELAADVVASAAGAAVVLGPAVDSARAVRALREGGFKGLIAGGPWFGRSSFLAAAGEAAEGAVFPWVGMPSDPFRRNFATRYGVEPDYAAACGYDAVSLVVRAIRKAGLNRARIREALAAVAGHEGASGRIDWDTFGQNRREPVVGLARSGKLVVRPE